MLPSGTEKRSVAAGVVDVSLRGTTRKLRSSHLVANSPIAILPTVSPGAAAADPVKMMSHPAHSENDRLNL